MAAWSVYMVSCADGSLYTGISRDVAGRVAVHNSGRGAKYTRSRLPVHLVYEEVLTDRSSALKREIEIKRMTPKDKRQLVRKSADPVSEASSGCAQRPEHG